VTPELQTALDEQRAFAVIRTDTAAQALHAARACLAGGLRLIEITLTVPGALDVIGRLAEDAGAIVGVGSLVDAAQVAPAARAGARFAVSPHFDREILAEAKAHGLLASMGGVTATLREPLPFLRLMPTGGVDESNLRAWLDAGAVAVGLGGSLADRKTVAAGDFRTVEGRARRVVAMVAEWRLQRAQ
jgi:2-dehydro-3-deoxyphosphogluconate aldolase/(4S)-4-hydroxy-2-oxoglutarate aldolase